jgi:hypothetical protein
MIEAYIVMNLKQSREIYNLNMNQRREYPSATSRQLQPFGNAMAWKHRKASAMPFQIWRPFPPEAIVQVKSKDGETKIGPAKTFWWGYETECGEIGESVILSARRLDRSKFE